MIAKIANRRAQVTIFIVVGLVLLGIAGILISLSNSLKTDSLTQAKPQDERVKFDAAVKIIRDCITTSAQRALVETALRGGATENEVTVPVSPLRGQTQDSFVSIGINRSAESLPIPTTLPFVAIGDIRAVPIDPLQNQKVKTLGGRVTLPKLCDQFGPNNSSNQYVNYTCEMFTYNLAGEYPIQNKLASIIQDDTIKCAKSSKELLEDIGQDVSTYFGIAPQVIFGDSDVTVSFTFDTNVSIRKSNFSFHETTVVIPARYKRLYNFLYRVLEADSRDILFDKRTGYSTVNTCNYPGSSACWSDGFTFAVISTYTAPDGKVFDIVAASDKKSKIGDNQLTFRTAIENRRPVIDPLSIYDVFSFPNVATYPDISDWQRRYTTYARSGQTILLKPLAYDFDEEVDLKYIYSGWKADEDYSFITGTSSDQEGCTVFSTDDPFYPTQCFYWDARFLEDPKPALSNKWHESADYMVGDVNCDGVIGKCASYTTNPDGTDLGAHTVLISVRDRADRYDAVEAAILVGTD